METECVDFIKNLPTEISQKILRSLKRSDIINCCLVSKDWYRICNSNVIWKPFWNPAKLLKESNRIKDFNWTLSPPCKWKRYILNHARILNNWKENRYKEYRMEGRWKDTTAYDGKTLVVNNGHLDIYNVNNGEIKKVQKLRLKNYDAYMCVTNSTFVTVKYKPCIAVFRKKSRRYKMEYVLYNPKGTKNLTLTTDLKKVEKNCDIQFFYPYWSNLMCILGDTLYVYFPHVKVLYAWELAERKCLLEFEVSHFDVSYDRKCVYICKKQNITAFDKNGKETLKLTTTWDEIDKMFCNESIIFVLRMVNEKVEFCVWEKFTGKFLYNRKTSLSQFIMLHPTKNIVIDLVDNRELESKEITAFDMDTGTILWKTQVDEYSLLGDIHSVVAERFLLFATFTRHIFNIYDITTGEYLYSLDRIDDDDLFAYHDLLLYSCNKKSNLIVHLYSA